MHPGMPFDRRDQGEFIERVEAMKGNLVGTLRIVVLDILVQNPALKLSDALGKLTLWEGAQDIRSSLRE